MFLAQVDRFLEFLLPPLINLIQNSAKVIKAPKTILAFLFDPINDRLWPQVVLSVCGSSFRTHLGEQCSLNIKNFINWALLEYWLTSNLSPRFLPIICQHVSSKSKEIRRHTCEFLDQVLSLIFIQISKYEFNFISNPFNLSCYIPGRLIPLRNMWQSCRRWTQLL